MEELLFSQEELVWQNEKTPFIKLHRNEHVRVEFARVENYSKAIIFFKKKAVKTNGFSSADLINDLPWYYDSLINRKSVGEFLRYKTDLSYELIDEFLMKIGCQPNELLSKLSNQLKQLISLKILLAKNERRVILNTGGMDIRCLTEVYHLIKELINSQGTCLEITYPPFTSSVELMDFLGKEPKIIRTTVL